MSATKVHRPRETGSSAALLEVRDLRKRFGGLVATDGVDLAIAEGETRALIGPNGAGKTTLLAQVNGTLRPDGGTILFHGRDITRLPPHARAGLGFARSFQVTSVFRNFTVGENVALAVQARSGSSFRFWTPVSGERAIHDAAGEALSRVGLAEMASRPAGVLSHGEHRQLELALALATQPRILLLDEPMAGMGPEESARMIELIEQLKGSFTILLVEHDMDAVFRLADVVSVMVAGRILVTGSVDDIRCNEEVRIAYLGEDEVVP